jgi:hypothetical protein
MNRHETLELTKLAGATGVWLLQWCVLIPGLLLLIAAGPEQTSTARGV